MTIRTTASPSPIDVDTTIAVTPPLGPIPAIYVPRRSTQQHTSLSVRRTVIRAMKHMADRAKASV
jgi:hypothetical protein